MKNASRIPALTLIFVLIISILCFSACNQNNLWDNKYLSSILPDVTMTSVTGRDTEIIANWIDPEMLSLNRIEVICTNVTDTITVLPGVQTCTINGLTNGTYYTVTIVVVDLYENKSPGVSFTIAPSASGTNGRFIYTADDLNAVHGGNPVGTVYETWTIADTYYLMDDLNLSGYSSGLGWKPIGTNSSPFAGAFKGNNHTISNLTINRGTEDYVGLFGYIDTTDNISDLNLTNVNITGRDYTGGLAGYNTGNIQGCSVSGSVSGAGYIGGLIGYNSGNNIQGCSASGSVSGAACTGGLIGHNDNGIIEHSYTTTTVTGQDNTGGLVGDSSAGAINYSYSEGNVTGTNYVGGLVGNSSSSIEECYATGDVTVSSNYIGGLVAYNTGAIINSYAMGRVTATGAASSGIGGLLGYNGMTSNVDGCYSKGQIIKTGGAIIFGGLVGGNDGSVGNTLLCYYDTTTSGMSDSGKGISRTTNQMKLIDLSQTTYDSWNFTAVWAIDGSINYSYPYLINTP